MAADRFGKQSRSSEAQQKPIGPLWTLVEMWRERAITLRRNARWNTMSGNALAAADSEARAYINAANELEDRLRNGEG